MGKKKKKHKKAQDNGQAGGTGGATAMQVEAVVVGGHCAELYPSMILRVGPESQLLFHAGAGLQRYWCALTVLGWSPYNDKGECLRVLPSAAS